MSPILGLLSPILGNSINKILDKVFPQDNPELSAKRLELESEIL